MDILLVRRITDFYLSCRTSLMARFAQGLACSWERRLSESESESGKRGKREGRQFDTPVEFVL